MKDTSVSEANLPSMQTLYVGLVKTLMKLSNARLQAGSRGLCLTMWKAVPGCAEE